MVDNSNPDQAPQKLGQEILVAAVTFAQLANTFIPDSSHTLTKTKGCV